jgi:cellulose synthase/poly-beta-1,6-N-acetylglucosamine synthase-like glycosyltransferase
LSDNALIDTGLKATKMNPASASKEDRSYALLTAAYNEEQHIETTIRSVVEQFHGSKIWVIVSDGSTDRTDDIVQQYAIQHSFIRPLRRERDHCREFASKVFAALDPLHRSPGCRFMVAPILFP